MSLFSAFTIICIGSMVFTIQQDLGSCDLKVPMVKTIRLTDLLNSSSCCGRCFPLTSSEILTFDFDYYITTEPVYNIYVLRKWLRGANAVKLSTFTYICVDIICYMNCR